MTLTPLPAPTLDYFCTLAVAPSRPLTLGATHHGTRRIIPIGGGTVTGPGISGRILGMGADWQTLFDTGVAELDARYAFELDDGAVIEIRDLGLRRASPDVLEQLASGGDVDPDSYYMRTAARLTTGAETYAWVNSTLFLGRDARVLIAGGGIGGLSLALTLEQFGVPFTVFESVRELAPLGVGINIQPNAVRELYDLGISEADLDGVGVASKEWALVGLNGNDIYAEPRGLLAGYNWPQYAVHRGRFHMMLYNKLVERAGADCVRLGQRVTGYRHNADGSVTALLRDIDGNEHTETGTLLIGADGIHSDIRAQMHPDQPPINWGGAIMWRGTTKAKPIRTGSSFIGLGTHQHRIVIYPISPADPETGLATINWIAELTVDNSEGWRNSGWFRPVEIDDFIAHFADWRYDWLDVPAMLRGAEIAYENPMIDRDPVSTWQDGPVALMGDAAHAMYPTGSNGASQAIIDARVLGAMLIEHGVGTSALAAFDAKLCGPVSELILRNRGSGPFGLLNMVDSRCGGVFDNIDDVIPPDERDAFMAKYKAAAGFAIKELNAAPPIIGDRRKADA